MELISFKKKSCFRHSCWSETTEKQLRVFVWGEKPPFIGVTAPSSETHRVRSVRLLSRGSEPQRGVEDKSVSLCCVCFGERLCCLPPALSGLRRKSPLACYWRSLNLPVWQCGGQREWPLTWRADLLTETHRHKAPHWCHAHILDSV